jgi:quercetin dioxygenase-like cupin family protein
MKNSGIKIVQPETAEWVQHPQLKTAKVVYMLSNKHDEINITCMLVKLVKGTNVEKHSHPESDDIIYVVEGEATMWIDGIGDVPMVKGSFIRIPKGVLHQPHRIEKDLLAYDVFYPSLV